MNLHLSLFLGLKDFMLLPFEIFPNSSELLLIFVLLDVLLPLSAGGLFRVRSWGSASACFRHFGVSGDAGLDDDFDFFSYRI